MTVIRYIDCDDFRKLHRLKRPDNFQPIFYSKKEVGGWPGRSFHQAVIKIKEKQIEGGKN